MVKQPSTRNLEIGLAASDMELDAALLLMELWRGVHHNGSAASSGGVKRKEEERDDIDHSSKAETPTTTLVKGIFDNVEDDDDEDENDFHLRPRKRRFRSIVDIYRSTKFLDKYNAEKERKVVTMKCS
ncbi:hypothetical protein SLE2022_384460 [Rubroshorea leprosula]